MLNHRVYQFLRQHPGTEDIEELPMSFAQRQGKKADFFLFERSVIAEVKEIVEDRQGPMSRVLDRYRRSGAIHIPAGDPWLEDVLHGHPMRGRILDDLARARGHPIEKAFKDANAQIKNTRLAWQVPGAAGMLILVNESIDLIDPPLVVAVVQHMLFKTKKDFRFVFPAIDSVLYMTKAHQIVDHEGRQNDPFFVIKRAGRPRDEELTSREHIIGSAWAASLGLPYLFGGSIDPTALRWNYQPGSKPPPMI